MKTKVIVLAAICMAAFTQAKSQVYVQGGVNLANITTSKAGETQNSNLMTSFNAGIMSRFGISQVFDLESGLLVDGRGAKTETYFTNSKDDNYVKTRFNPLYLKLPVHGVVKFPVGTNNANVFLFAGPYASMGLGGNSKKTVKLLGAESKSTDKIKFSDDDPTTPDEQEGAGFDRLKRFAFGVDAGAGVDFGKVMVKVNYGIGLTKINSTQTDNNSDDQNKYRTWSISLGIPLTR